MGIFNRKGKKAENAVQVNNVSEQTIFACGWDGLWTPHKKGFKPFGKIFLQMALNQIFNGVSNVSFESLKDNYVCNGICSFLDNNATLLVDTYNTLKSGIPNAIRAFNEVLKPLGITKCGIRLDSGDMAYLTKKARKMLDEAGWTECQISVSNSLDEYIIRDLLRQDAKIDMFGVGERLITA